ncbi:hypothetical protein JOD54_004900 [Actinokineospora baliensis]|uniref:right-handed parallel beta-helix repeat-containing protein n=1 Tax=Actinokineospora baliensis TaxID=547056 RepID=UPI0019597413|nr:right-handed parallel beta-helix repeat-containing protein [Actinokineospora baliensis]MBM7774696.1 hypothetical protein [Actinokineospora baliensis]
MALAVLGVAVPAPASAAVTLQCGDIVYASVVLANDLDCTNSEALSAGADGVTISLAGHTVHGLVHDRDHAGFAVRGGTVDLIWIFGPSGARITDVRTSLIRVGGDDTKIVRTTVGDLLVLNPHSDVDIADSTITGSFTASGSVGRSGSLIRSTITGARVDFSSGWNGFLLRDNRFQSSTVDFSQSDGGVLVENTFTDSTVTISSSNNTDIRKNTFRGSQTALRLASEPQQNTNIAYNTFESNGVGIRVVDNSTAPLRGTSIRGNTFTGNTTAGIWATLQAASTDLVTIEANTLTGNGHSPNGTVDTQGSLVNDGIHIDAAAGNNLRLTRNTTRDNADHGIEATPGSVVDGGGNTTANNPAGCRGVLCRQVA